MKAVILAGGLGTRLGEETDVKPKPMVEIGGMPILWHIMKIYSAHGVNDFVICLGYKGYVIKEYFANYFLHTADVTLDLSDNTMEVHRQRSEPWRITLVDTGATTQTGGRIKAVKSFLDPDEPFCMTYGDGVSDIDIGATIAFHRAHGDKATITAVAPPGRFGALDLVENKVTSFTEKPAGDGGLINGGFFVLHPSVVDLIDAPETIWEREPLERLAADGELQAFHHEGFWQPMASPALGHRVLLHSCAAVRHHCRQDPPHGAGYLFRRAFNHCHLLRDGGPLPAPDGHPVDRGGTCTTEPDDDLEGHPPPGLVLPLAVAPRCPVVALGQAAGAPVRGMKLLSPSNWRKGLALALVMLLALLLRLHGLRAGLPALNDPDELMFQLGALKMLRSGTLNPGWFGHPASTTMDALAITDVLVFLTGHLLGAFANVKAFATTIYADPTIVMLPGRLVMVVASLGTVWLTGLFAARQWGREAGLGAAAVLAVSPVFVVWSQVIRSDIFACCFMMLGLLAAQQIARGAGCRRDLVLCAFWSAAAIASKWPFAMVAAAAFGAILLDSARRGLSSPATATRLALYAVLTSAFLIAISPYLLLDFSTVVRNVAGEAQARHLGATGGSPLWNAGWYLGGPIARALGLIGYAMATIGLIQLRRDRAALFLIPPLLLGFSLLLISQHLVWERWALPLIVLLALPTGVAIARLAQSIVPRTPRVAFAALLVATLAQPTWATIIQGNARNNDTRQRASAWAVAHFKPHARVLVEQFAFDLLPQPWTFYFPLGQAGCVNANDWLQGKVGYSPVEAGRGNRANVDYGTLAPERESACRPDFAIISQYDRYLAERPEYPEEVARYERLIRRGRVVAIFTPLPGKSAGPVVRIVAFGPVGP